jgi:hypothetical protein
MANRVFMFGGGTQKQKIACNGAGWIPSEWREACGRYAASIRRRHYVPIMKIDFGSARMHGAEEYVGDPSKAWPANTEIATHFLIPASLVKNIVLHNCLPIAATLDISVVSSFGNTAPANIGNLTLDQVTDANVPAGDYPGSLTTQVVAAGIDLSVIGFTRFPLDLFTQDEGLVVIKFNPVSGTTINVGCLSIAVDITDFNEECICECDALPCDTLYPPTIPCFPG